MRCKAAIERTCLSVTTVDKGDARIWYDILLPVLQGEDAYSRAMAARELGRLKEGRAVRPLVTALIDPEPAVRAAAATALGELRIERARERLITLTDDPDPQVQESANNAIEELNYYTRYTFRTRADEKRAGADQPVVGRAASLEKFEQCIRDERKGYAAGAIGCLVKMHDLRGARLLILALQHWDVEVREQAGHALIALTEEDFGWDLEIWQLWWEQIAETLQMD